MGIWAGNTSISDEDMLAGFAKWSADYDCFAVLSANDPETLARLAHADPNYLWLESFCGFGQLVNVREHEIFLPDGSLNLRERDGEVPLAFYVCRNPANGDSSIKLTGGVFLCEECEGDVGDGDADCGLCEGEGGFYGSIHDESTKKELFVELSDLDATIPAGFVFSSTGPEGHACSMEIWENFPLR